MCWTCGHPTAAVEINEGLGWKDSAEMPPIPNQGGTRKDQPSEKSHTQILSCPHPQPPSHGALDPRLLFSASGWELGAGSLGEGEGWGGGALLLGSLFGELYLARKQKQAGVKGVRIKQGWGWSMLWNWQRNPVNSKIEELQETRWWAYEPPASFQWVAAKPALENSAFPSDFKWLDCLKNNWWFLNSHRKWTI